MTDLTSKFLRVRNPNDETFWMRIRRVIAEFFYPMYRSKRYEWVAKYHTHEYMLSVHRFYERENRKLNLALTRKEKEIRELHKKLKQEQDRIGDG